MNGQRKTNHYQEGGDKGHDQSVRAATNKRKDIRARPGDNPRRKKRVNTLSQPRPH